MGDKKQGKTRSGKNTIRRPNNKAIKKGTRKNGKGPNKIKKENILKEKDNDKSEETKSKLSKGIKEGKRKNMKNNMKPKKDNTKSENEKSKKIKDKSQKIDDR